MPVFSGSLCYSELERAKRYVFLEEMSGYLLIPAEESQHGMKGAIILTGRRVTLQSDFKNFSSAN